jgi:hypothetical protein
MLRRVSGIVTANGRPVRGAALLITIETASGSHLLHGVTSRSGRYDVAANVIGQVSRTVFRCLSAEASVPGNAWAGIDVDISSGVARFVPAGDAPMVPAAGGGSQAPSAALVSLHGAGALPGGTTVPAAVQAKINSDFVAAMRERAAALQNGAISLRQIVDRPAYRSFCQAWLASLRSAGVPDDLIAKYLPELAPLATRDGGLPSAPPDTHAGLTFAAQPRLKQLKGLLAGDSTAWRPQPGPLGYINPGYKVPILVSKNPLPVPFTPKSAK